jgi:hypothetical protein
MKRLEARYKWLKPTFQGRRICVTAYLGQFLSVLLLFFGALHACYAADEAMKADYLVKFAKYVTWPKASGDLNLCVIGPDPFGAALDKKIAGETVKKRQLVAKRLNAKANIEDCDILFFSNKLSKTEMKTILARAEKGILTVSDIADFSANNGMIEFFNAEGKLRFEINNNAAQKAGLRLSSNLLKLAAKK